MVPLHTVIPDECCSAKLIGALHESKIDAEARWTCPTCEMEWRREVHMLDQGEGMYLWVPHCPVAIIR